MSDDRFAAAIALIDAANAQDPRGRELLYSQRMTQALEDFEPTASDALRLAARAQHIRRWEIPRESYEPDRVGYLKWRTQLYAFHADVTEAILRQAGYDDDTTSRVRDLLMKKGIKTDPQMQTLEDVICLVFLQHYLDEFLAEHGHDQEKIVNILRRTWKKMSDRGRAAALELKLSEDARRLIAVALQSP